MPGFRLLLLGPVRLISPAGDVVEGIGAKQKALLAYLALEPQAPRERLASLIWDSAEGRHALRQALLMLRRRLGADAQMAISRDAATVALGPTVETDVELFEAHLRLGRFEAACALWQGPFCDALDAGGEGFEEWLAQARGRLAERAAWGFSQLAAQAEAAGRTEVAIAAARRLVALDPLNDTAQAALIALYRSEGCVVAARLAHRRCVGLYHRELGIAPGAEVHTAARLPARPRASPPRPRRTAPAQRWGALVAGGLALSLAAFLASERAGVAPHAAAAAPAAAWVDASEWRADARPDSGDVPLAEAIARGLAGDPEFAHLAPGGC